MFTVKEAKGNFFSTDLVKGLVDKAKRANLSKWGAYVRTDARSSLRYRKESSPPGAPPSVHKTMTRTKTNKKGETKRQQVSPLREFLFFAYDPSSKSAVAGPARLAGKLGNAPQALEEGGTSEVRTTIWDHHRRVPATVKAQIRPHPTMAPAAARVNKKLPEIWANSVRR